jgi:hypothetical protein
MRPLLHASAIVDFESLIQPLFKSSFDRVIFRPVQRALRRDRLTVIRLDTESLGYQYPFSTQPHRVARRRLGVGALLSRLVSRDG